MEPPLSMQTFPEKAALVIKECVQCYLHFAVNFIILGYNTLIFIAITKITHDVLVSQAP